METRIRPEGRHRSRPGSLRIMTTLPLNLPARGVQHLRSEVHQEQEMHRASPRDLVRHDVPAAQSGAFGYGLTPVPWRAGRSQLMARAIDQFCATSRPGRGCPGGVGFVGSGAIGHLIASPVTQRLDDMPHLCAAVRWVCTNIPAISAAHTVLIFALHPCASIR